MQRIQNKPGINSVNSMQWIFILLGSFVLLFIIAPITGMFLATTGTSVFETAASKEVSDSIWLTIIVSFVTTLVFSVFSIPLAYILARYKIPCKRLINGIIDLPIVIPHSAAGIAMLGFISRNSIVGATAGKFGLNFVGNPIGIGLAMAFVSVPFLINAAREGFAGIPDKIEKTALNLGASPSYMFFTVSLPLAWRHIVSGMLMMFARGMSEFGAVVIVAYHPMITPVLIYERFCSFGLKYAQPVAVLFILICLVFFILLRILSSEKYARN